MRRMLAALLIAGGACALCACAAPAPPPPDDAEVQEWMQRQSDDAGDVTGVMVSLAGTAPNSEGEGTQMDFGGPTDIVSVEFSCFGDDTMTVTLAVTAGDQGEGVEIGDLRCDESPHRLEGKILTSDVDSFHANAISTHGYGAWSVVVR